MTSFPLSPSAFTSTLSSPSFDLSSFLNSTLSSPSSGHSTLSSLTLQTSVTLSSLTKTVSTKTLSQILEEIERLKSDKILLQTKITSFRNDTASEDPNDSNVHLSKLSQLHSRLSELKSSLQTSKLIEDVNTCIKRLTILTSLDPNLDNLYLECSNLISLQSKIPPSSLTELQSDITDTLSSLPSLLKPLYTSALQNTKNVKIKLDLEKIYNLISFTSEMESVRIEFETVKSVKSWLEIRREFSVERFKSFLSNLDTNVIKSVLKKITISFKSLLNDLTFNECVECFKLIEGYDTDIFGDFLLNATKNVRRNYEKLLKNKVIENVEDCVSEITYLDNHLTSLSSSFKILNVTTSWNPFIVSLEEEINRVMEGINIEGFEDDNLGVRIGVSIKLIYLSEMFKNVKKRFNIEGGGGFEFEGINILFPGFTVTERGEGGTPSKWVTVFGDYLLNLSRQFDETDFKLIEDCKVEGACDCVVGGFWNLEEFKNESWPGEVEEMLIYEECERNVKGSIINEVITCGIIELQKRIKAPVEQVEVDFRYYLNLVMALTEWRPVGVEVLGYEVWLLGGG
ncbi:hypothetical protein TL16_g12572 [Triparma laevis f. inornata]|uniref:Uncharacterized protein n=1 Tax=Triparma laevis f. inornata TaxID=1714386 RepID=A0A9W7BTH2_9STRA|nr:hypothetical protein TL16_g12572 [Triparma laevis f. inornata]